MPTKITWQKLVEVFVVLAIAIVPAVLLKLFPWRQPAKFHASVVVTGVKFELAPFDQPAFLLSSLVNMTLDYERLKLPNGKSLLPKNKPVQFKNVTGTLNLATGANISIEWDGTIARGNGVFLRIETAQKRDDDWGRINVAPDSRVLVKNVAEPKMSGPAWFAGDDNGWIGMSLDPAAGVSSLPNEGGLVLKDGTELLFADDPKFAIGQPGGSFLNDDIGGTPIMLSRSEALRLGKLTQAKIQNMDIDRAGIHLQIVGTANELEIRGKDERPTELELLSASRPWVVFLATGLWFGGAIFKAWSQLRKD